MLSGELNIQLLISLNARLFKVFNIATSDTFKIAHLKRVLGASFHIPSNQIHFTLVSGRFTRDNDSMFDLRASDGNLASLDVGLSASYATSSLAGGIISFKYQPNPNPSSLDGKSVDGIQEVPIVSPTIPPMMAIPGPSRDPSGSSITVPKQNLTREQRIAMRAQLEDPFSIGSRSCFEDDSDEDEFEDDEDDCKSDEDDDWYSDDGEEALDSTSDQGSEPSSVSSSPLASPTHSLTSDIPTEVWPSEPSKLSPRHLRRLLAINPERDPRKEVQLRTTFLRYKFQCRAFERLQTLIDQESSSDNTFKVYQRLEEEQTSLEVCSMTITPNSTQIENHKTLNGESSESITSIDDR